MGPVKRGGTGAGDFFCYFLKTLGLDPRITSWDQKVRIPREKLPLY